MNEKQLEKLEELIEKISDDDQYITRTSITKPKDRVTITKLKIAKELVFGSREFENRVLELEEAQMKKEGFKSSTVHWCGVKHYSHKEKLMGFDYDKIDEICFCNEKKKAEYNPKGLKLQVCPNGHGTLSSYGIKFMKSCRTCTDTLNKHVASTVSPEEKEARERRAAENKLREDGEKLVKIAKENAEIERQAKVLARAEILKEEMKNEKK